MSAQNNEVNRTVDGDTAEGHLRSHTIEEADEAGTTTAIRQIHSLDDEAEGHIRARG
jgi:hypothetical protein